MPDQVRTPAADRPGMRATSKSGGNAQLTVSRNRFNPRLTLCVLVLSTASAAALLVGCATSDENLLDAESSTVISDPGDESSRSEDEIASAKPEVAASPEVMISATSPAAVVPGEAFTAMVTLSVSSRTDGVKVEFSLPDGIAIRSGDCPAGSGILVCVLPGYVSAEEPVPLSIDMVVDPDSSLGMNGGDIEVKAVASDWFPGPDDATATLAISVNPS